jgi:hypothetical protein
MKKVFAVLAIAGMFAFVACGPKAEEQAAETTETVVTEEAAVVEEAPVAEEAAPVDSTATEPAPAQ